VGKIFKQVLPSNRGVISMKVLVYLIIATTLLLIFGAFATVFYVIGC